jgi:nitrogen fixation NifU-like protein
MSSHPEPATDLASLYREAVKRHAAEPVGYKAPIEATHRYEAYNPLCGDRVEICLRVTGDQVEAAAFDGAACAICTASASMLCSLAPARPVAWLRLLGDRLKNVLAESDIDREQGSLLRSLDDDSADASIDGDPTEDAADALPNELKPLLGVRRYPSRRRCATLPWEAAVNALDQGEIPPPGR